MSQTGLSDLVMISIKNEHTKKLSTIGHWSSRLHKIEAVKISFIVICIYFISLYI